MAVSNVHSRTGQDTVSRFPGHLWIFVRTERSSSRRGVYFLFGKDEQSEKNVVYVGQASVRKNGEGILNRLCEHNNNPNKDYWTEAIAITTSNDSLGPTEISYLEHTFCKLAHEVKRYEVKNGNDPTIGNLYEEKQAEMDDFIDYAKVIIGTLGHKVFIPLVDAVTDHDPREKLYCKKKDADATGVQTSDGFVVKKGSKISPTTTNSCPEYALNRRKQHQDIIGVDFVLREDVLFNSPSGAACFVCGYSVSGNAEWKNAEGKALGEINSGAG